MFEAIHGSAPRKIEAGEGDYANPASILKAAEMMLRHIAMPEKAERLLAAMRGFQEKHREDALLLIAADGLVDPEEEPRFKAIVRDLYAVVQAALQIDYAEKGGDA